MGREYAKVRRTFNRFQISIDFPQAILHIKGVGNNL